MAHGIEKTFWHGRGFVEVLTLGGSSVLRRAFILRLGFFISHRGKGSFSISNCFFVSLGAQLRRLTVFAHYLKLIVNEFFGECIV
jgi:hypothetical protein